MLKGQSKIAMATRSQHGTSAMTKHDGWVMTDITSIPGMSFARVTEESENFIIFHVDCDTGRSPVTLSALELMRDMGLRIVDANLNKVLGLRLVCEKL